MNIRISILFLFAAHVTCLCGQQAKSDKRRELTRDNVMVFRDSDSQLKKVTSVDQWNERRQSILQAMQSVRVLGMHK